MNESDITPINHFFYFNKLDKTENILLDSGYKVWMSDEDIEINADDFAKGDVKGLVLCKGDVTFDATVKSFEGLIVSGGKIIVNQTMNFSANEEIIKSILRECDESQKYKGTLENARNHFNVCEMFQQYQSFYVPETETGDIKTESMKSISAVQFEDILSFQNWKKNVD